MEIIARHPMLWRFNALLFLIGAVGAVIGCALAFPAREGALVLPSLLSFTAATALWAVNLALRMSAVPAFAQEGSARSGALLTLLQSWTAAAWGVAGALVILAFVGLRAHVLIASALPSRAGWVCVASSTLSAAIFVVTRDLPPAVAYLPVLPLALASTIEALSSAR